MNQLFQWVNHDENIKNAVQQFEQPGCHSIYGLGGSVKSLLVGKAWCETQKQAIVIVPSKENVADWMSDLQFMVPNVRVLDFPFVDKAVFTTTAKSMDRSARQMEVLGYLRSGQAGIVLATPEEALQYILAPQRIDDAVIDIAVATEYDREQLLQHIVDSGYERVDLVERRGHFSVRGDIIDLYAVNYPDPLRLEFFGDEIESIRFFDVTNQKSKDTTQDVRILPISLECQPEEASCTLLDYIGDGVLIWDEPNRVRENLKKLLKESDEYKGLVCPWKKAVSQQRGNTQIVLSLLAQSVPDMMIDSSVSFAAKMMASFQKQFNLLADELTH